MCFSILRVCVYAGPSVLDVFKTLVKQLTASIESMPCSSEQDGGRSDSLRFQDSLTKTMGEFAGVLPDYQKPDIMTLINSYMPTLDEMNGVEVVTHSETDDASTQARGEQQMDHPLSDRCSSFIDMVIRALLMLVFMFSNQQLMASLVKCLKAVADSYNPAILDTTIPSNLFGSLVKLLAVKDPGEILNVYGVVLL